MTLRYGFRRMTAGDLPMIRQWLETPEALRWWGDPRTEYDILEGDLAELRLRQWIVSCGELPFAYMQDYDIHAWPGHPFSGTPEGTCGVDQFIGVPAMIGRGHGSAFVRQHVDALLAGGVPCVVTDPDPANARAVRAYEKAGFRLLRSYDDTNEWGPCLLMERRA